MSAAALIIVILGAAIVLSRAPLIIAPEAVRGTYLKLFDTDGKMRLMGVIMGAVSATIVWLTWGIGDTASQVLRDIAGVVLVLSVCAMIPFPAWARRLATNVWSAFSPGVLRLLGVLAVAVWGLIIWYGLSL